MALLVEAALRAAAQGVLDAGKAVLAMLAAFLRVLVVVLEAPLAIDHRLRRRQVDMRPKHEIQRLLLASDARPPVLRYCLIRHPGIGLPIYRRRFAHKNSGLLQLFVALAVELVRVLRVEGYILKATSSRRGYVSSVSAYPLACWRALEQHMA